METEARSLGLNGQVHFVGFTNQTQLPGVYRASDLMVLPSEYEPFGVVVNEAMLCGCPVAASDRVGAAYDLIRTGENGFVFPSGDVDALSTILRKSLTNHDGLRLFGEAARQRMQSWSPSDGIEAIIKALDCAVAFRSKRSREPSQ